MNNGSILYCAILLPPFTVQHLHVSLLIFLSEYFEWTWHILLGFSTATQHCFSHRHTVSQWSQKTCITYKEHFCGRKIARCWAMFHEETWRSAAQCHQALELQEKSLLQHRRGTLIFLAYCPHLSPPVALSWTTTFCPQIVKRTVVAWLPVNCCLVFWTWPSSGSGERLLVVL